MKLDEPCDTGNRETRARAARKKWIQVHGCIPEGMWVLHHCDNPPCNEITHLYLGTARDNTSDKRLRHRDKGLSALHGSENGNAKLTQEEVIEIRKLREEGWSNAALASLFQMSRASISQICHRKSWKRTQ